jgi:hypothetical protein
VEAINVPYYFSRPEGTKGSAHEVRVLRGRNPRFRHSVPFLWSGEEGWTLVSACPAVRTDAP